MDAWVGGWMQGRAALVLTPRNGSIRPCGEIGLNKQRNDTDNDGDSFCDVSTAPRTRTRTQPALQNRTSLSQRDHTLPSRGEKLPVPHLQALGVTSG
ncbi:hypothetical protein CKAH01_08134 [Colletotrichum kahawae]|uniref:Uncharacterized protein n=1 Tax=Colletotrichum kahawae TaxID=34407 RepID=A0AAD9Y211_COLKA|nr:hypothetical protein CKAH01_08134 [Colletotrichum kahawae]